MKRTFLVSFSLFLSGSIFSQQPELPLFAPTDVVVSHTGYTLKYNEQFEQAEWVAYELTAEETGGAEERGDNFHADPSILTGSATPDDYKKSGYDRGHLIPAADLSWSPEAMDDSFYMSNMSPQAPSFNRGRWKELEDQVRDWAKKDGKLYVVTGPVLTDGPYSMIGPNEVAVPHFYYKVLLDLSEPEIKGIAFLLPNRKCPRSLEMYALSIDAVELIAGVNFFHILEDEFEESIESAYDIGLWFPVNVSVQGK